MGNKNNQDFTGMNSDNKEDIASEGDGKSQIQENNPGSVPNDPQRGSETGQKGGKSSREDSDYKSRQDQTEDALEESDFEMDQD